MYFCDTQQKQKQKNGKKKLLPVNATPLSTLQKNQKRIKTKTNFQTNIKCIAEKNLIKNYSSRSLLKNLLKSIYYVLNILLGIY